MCPVNKDTQESILVSIKSMQQVNKFKEYKSLAMYQ